MQCYRARHIQITPNIMKVNKDAKVTNYFFKVVTKHKKLSLI